MASHFSWYPSADNVVVPWNARYSFPSQANKAVKMTPRIPPKNGNYFTPGQVIRVEFPAQGYVNPGKTTLEFDVSLNVPQLVGTVDDAAKVMTVRFQNNIQSIFNRVRLLYGATPIEDIINYGVIVRNLTEWTAGNPHMTMDQMTISDGIGGVVVDADTTGTFGINNIRQKYIQGAHYAFPGTTAAFTAGNGNGYVPQTGIQVSGHTTPPNAATVTRRYQISFLLGLFTQDKLIPVKFMASQLAIEISLEQPQACILSTVGASYTTYIPSYGVGNVNLIPEILEFDASYDAMFIRGLQEGGVPIKFSSWYI